ncbi:MAG: hypothetical protein K0R90_138 [Oscillospiraceae bacterium]|jgi:hypothetical protein|nr:hypothetical protein [Oscillospiraceae bacterium]
MLKKNYFNNFTSKEIKPKGWLLQQLKIQAEGLSGHLDKIWPDIQDSKWIGGQRDGWERVPYWLDGFIPLAYLLEDEDMIARAKKYVDAIIQNQQEDGWLCPCSMEERKHYDMWALFLICKALVVYYECSDDVRIEPVIYKALKNLKDHIRHNTISCWASSRWYESLISIYWLYERTKEEWLIDLAVSLYVQGTNYERLFDNWRDMHPRQEWSQQTHVVNLAMALKSQALISRLTQQDSNEFAKKMIGLLTKYHGTAAGHFTGDECLSGTSPIQGTELCGVVEAMYSYEHLFAITGDPDWIDRLEILAYNALPATTSSDMWTHQYDQMTNQIACVEFSEDSIFRTNGKEAHLFGLEPNFGCCTANFNQGWPKFALNTFLKDNDTIVSAALAPSKLETTIQNAAVSIELRTMYPFKNHLKYIITTADDVFFNLKIRIPSWVKSFTVDGDTYRNKGFFEINRIWNGTQEVLVDFEFETVFRKRPENLVCLQRGPLVYALSIDEEWKMHEYISESVERKFPYCDYEIYPKSKWNYAFWDENLSIQEYDIAEHPFSSQSPPVKMTANMVEIDWRTEQGYDFVCARVPFSRQPIGKVIKMELKPYGCTNLRLTEIPLLNSTSADTL